MRQKGFTLLEVLVAMLILSIGLLGLAGLMASGLRNNHSAYYRTQATWLAYDVIDRMRANQVNAADYGVEMGADAAGEGVAAVDIANWKAMIATTLPEGDGAVLVNAAGGVRTVTIDIQWNDSRGTNSPDDESTKTFTVMSRL